ncbi:MAG: hypothetical protein R2747_06615 [Pyrinomonadaceae bacterium]
MMKIKLLCVFILLMNSGLLISCESSKAENENVKKFEIATVKAVIYEANKVYGERFTKGDKRFYEEKYVRDACIMPENIAEICGRENIKNYYYGSGEKNKLKITITPKDIIGGEEVVVEIGGYELFDETSKSIDKGKFIATWRQEDGKWKLHREIWNTDNPKEEK